MDKIWYRNPSKLEVIGRFGGDEKNRMTMQNRQSRTLKKKFKKKKSISFVLSKIWPGQPTIMKQ